MKKITLKSFVILLTLSVSTSFLAQYSGPGEYLIIHKESGKVLTVESGEQNLIGADETDPLEDSQIFEIKELLGSDGTSTYYNISCKDANWDAVRAHSLNVWPTTTETPTSSGNNTRVFDFILEEGKTNSYDIHTPQTTTPRLWSYDAANNSNVRYTDVAGSGTKWELIPLFDVPLSTIDIKGKSVFIANPFSNEIRIHGLSKNVTKIEVFNLLGKRMLSAKTSGESSVNLNALSLTSGIYIVKFSGNNAVFTKKIVKE